MNDVELLNDVQSLLAEPLDGGGSYPSGMWTRAEVVGYLDHRQRELVAETGLVLTRVTLGCVPHVLRQALPQNWIATWRLVWVRASDGRHFPLHRADIWELDAALSDWRTEPGTPQHYTDGDVQPVTVQIVPAPNQAGTLKLTYIAEPTTLILDPTDLTVPDDASVPLVWGTVSEALTKEGRAKDMARTAIAEQRADLGTEAIRLLLSGWGG